MGATKRIKRHSSLLLFAERSNSQLISERSLSTAVDNKNNASVDADTDEEDDETEVDEDDDDDGTASAPPSLFETVMKSGRANNQIKRSRSTLTTSASSIALSSMGAATTSASAAAPPTNDDLMWGLPGQRSVKAKPNYVKLNLSSNRPGRGERRRTARPRGAKSWRRGGGGGGDDGARKVDTSGLSSAIDSDFRLQVAVRDALQQQQTASASTAQTTAAPNALPSLPLSPMPSDDELRTILRERFAHDDFRDGQLDVIRAVLRGESTLAVLATGSGKSLCYQLPAVLAHGVALVVSPLVALMADQVSQQASSVRGAFLSGQQSSSEAAGVIRRLLARELDVLYVAPERLMSARFVDLLRRVPIAFACVDEAHCVAAWSHNFRPCYMRLRAVLCDELRVGTLLAVTATATRATEARICASLGIGNVVRRSAARPNLRLAVSRELNRHTALVALLRGALKDARALIVYCAFKRQADEVAELLAQHEFDAASYHGDKSAEERTRVQRRFQKGQLRVVVATVAFGMGLNKLDVDGVVHFTMPRSLEHYVQETGRAGRDGRAAYCHVFLDDDDYTHLRSVTHSDCVDERALASFVRQVAPSGAARGAAVSVAAESAAEQLDVRAPVVDTLLAVLEERGVVRRLAPTLATCRISFVEAPLAQLAEHNPLLEAARRCGRDAGGGDFDVPLDALARVSQWTPDDVRAELRRLEGNRDIVCQLVTPAYACELVAPPSDATAGELAQYMTRLESAQVHKLDCAYDLFKRMAAGEVSSEQASTVIEAYFDNADEPPATTRALTGAPAAKTAWLKADIITCIRALRQANSSGAAPSARVVARILHALSSGQYPAATWSRSPFWGKHRSSDFNAVMELAQSVLDAQSGNGGGGGGGETTEQQQVQ
jgi:ATP-dependent DNA helicase Q4